MDDLVAFPFIIIKDTPPTPPYHSLTKTNDDYKFSVVLTTYFAYLFCLKYGKTLINFHPLLQAHSSVYLTPHSITK